MQTSNVLFIGLLMIMEQLLSTTSFFFHVFSTGNGGGGDGGTRTLALGTLRQVLRHYDTSSRNSAVGELVSVIKMFAKHNRLSLL